VRSTGGAVVHDHPRCYLGIDPLLLAQHLLKRLQVFSGWFAQFLLVLCLLRCSKALCAHVGEHGTSRMDIATALIRKAVQGKASGKLNIPAVLG
jgi:hypothetical protein